MKLLCSYPAIIKGEGENGAHSRLSVPPPIYRQCSDGKAP